MTPEQQKAIAIAKARQRKALAESQPGPLTPTAAELRTPGERAQYSREMTAQAFADRPDSGEYLISGAFGTNPIPPSMRQSPDLTQGEPPLSPAFLPDIVGATGGAALGVASRNLTRGALKRQAAAQRDWMDDLVEPYMGRKAQIERELRGADKTLFGTYKFRLSKQMRQQKEVLKSIPGVSAKKNLRDNLGAVSKEISNSGNKLNKALKMSTKSVSKPEVEAAIRSRVNEYRKTLRGVGFKVDDEMVDESIEAILKAMDDVPATPEGLWKARKLVDNEFRDLNGPRRYAAAVSGDPSSLIPTKNEVMWDLAREGMLELMEKKVPGARQQMRRMSIMYDIEHTIATKAPDIPTTAAGRAKKKMGFDKPISLRPRNWLNR